MKLNNILDLGFYLLNMQIKLYQVNGINDYFFYKINPSDTIIKELNVLYPKGISEYNTLNLNYEFNDIFVENMLNNKLKSLRANGIFFRTSQYNSFIELLNSFNDDIKNLNTFLLESIKKYNSEKYISDVFSYKLKLKQEVIQNMDKYFIKDLNYFQFKKDHLNECLALEILNKNESYSLYVNFNKESYIEKT